MAYSSSSLTQYFGLTIELDGLTLYLSDKYFVLDDGTSYDGLVKSLSPLSRSAGALQDPRVILPSMTITVDNKEDPQSGDRFQDYLTDNEWANVPITLRIGSSLAAADWTSIIVGRAKFPGGVSSDNLTVTVRVNDARAKDGRNLPASIFTTATYANMEAKSVGLPIPLVYGDWYTTAGNGETVPCYQIDSTVGTGGRFKVSSRELKSIEAVYKNGSSVSFTADLNNGNFTLNVAYTPASDTITCNCRGCTDDLTSAGTLLQSGPDVLNDLLKNVLGVSAANINSTAFSTWEGNLGASDYVRRWIGGDIVHSDTLIAELLNECFADMRIEAGKYYPTYRVVSPSTSDTLRDADLLVQGGPTIKQFSVHESPEEVYCNEVLADYSYNPVNDTFNERYLVEDAAAVVRVSQRIRRSMTFNWLYIPAGAQDRAAREVYVFSSNVRMIEIGVDASALTYGPASQFRLVYDRFIETASLANPFQVRDIQVDAQALRVTISAWDMLTLFTGTWTEDDTVTWLTATAEQRSTKGFWSDASGYADTSGSPDSASQRYRWN